MGRPLHYSAHALYVYEMCFILAFSQLANSVPTLSLAVSCPRFCRA